jgi:leader peptidase (prepilin peptidase)/N-methyltransferase
MLEYLAYFEAQFPYAVLSIVFVYGAVIGSFLNVVVYRLPIMLVRDWRSQAFEVVQDALNDDKAGLLETLKTVLLDDEGRFNLAYPPSRCPHCDGAIKPWQNIPIVGYFLLRGKCATCAEPISGRYPLVELITALLTVIVTAQLGLTAAGFAASVLTWSLVALALIDYDTQLLPDDITLPMLWLGLIVNFFGVITTFSSAFIGACAGYLVLWVVFQVFKLVTGKDGMGYGDFKLLAVLGAWLGWQVLPVVVLLSSITGAIIGGSLIAFGRDKAKPIPFGPYLAIAGWIAMLWGTELTNAYLEMTRY